MTQTTAATSPRLKARIAGVLYLVIIGAASFAELFVRSGLIVPGDAAATAANILASERLFRLGGAAQLVTVLCDVTLALIFFELMKPVSRGLALLSAFFRLAAIIVMAVATLAHFAPLAILKGGSDSSAFTSDQLQAVSMLFLRLHSSGYNITLLLFGVHCVLLGYLIARSTFLPRVIGVLLAVAGLGYVANSFAFFAYPPLTSWLFPVLVPIAFVAEGALALWLLVVGVNVQRWWEQGRAAGKKPGAGNSGDSLA